MKENLGLTNDFVFRNIFGAKKNSALLLSLVNAVLQAKGLEPVVSITPVSPFLPVHQLSQREGILDVQAVDASGRLYDLEIQVRNQKNYIKRSLFYLARMYGGQLSRGSEFEHLVPCISINFVDFVLFPDDGLFHHFFSLREFDNPDEELSRDLTLHYLELPKLIAHFNGIGPVGDDYLKILEKWLYLMKEIDNPEDTMVQKIISTTPELEKVQQEYDLFLTDEQLRWEALSHEMWLHDQASYRKEARDEGLAEGKAEGFAESTYGMARKMRDKGFELPVIMELTGLSEEEILKL